MVQFAVRFRTRAATPVATAPAAVPTAMARRIALAHRIEQLIDAGELADLADAARRLGVTRARLTQICDLALLAPAIQAAVLLGKVQPRDRHLRAVGRFPVWTDQVRAFLDLFPHVRLGDQS